MPRRSGICGMRWLPGSLSCLSAWWKAPHHQAAIKLAIAVDYRLNCRSRRSAKSVFIWGLLLSTSLSLPATAGDNKVTLWAD